MEKLSYARNLSEDREITINNMADDIFKIEAVLESIQDLTPEGEIIREDLLGLLHFGSDSYHQVDALMIERRKLERQKKFSIPTAEFNKKNSGIIYH